MISILKIVRYLLFYAIYQDYGSNVLHNRNDDNCFSDGNYTKNIHI